MSLYDGDMAVALLRAQKKIRRLERKIARLQAALDGVQPAAMTVPSPAMFTPGQGATTASAFLCFDPALEPAYVPANSPPPK